MTMLALVSVGCGLSFLYKRLKNHGATGIEDKKALADYFNVHYKRLGNWLHTLTYIAMCVRITVACGTASWQTMNIAGYRWGCLKHGRITLCGTEQPI